MNIPTFESIDRHRRILDLTQRRLCREAGISVSTYSRIKGGKTSPNLRTLGDLTAALGRLSHPGASPAAEAAPVSPAEPASSAGTSFEPGRAAE